MVRLVQQDRRIADGTSPRLPGRGAYLHRQESCLDLALRRRAVQRALRVEVPADDPVVAALRADAPGWNLTPPAG